MAASTAFPACCVNLTWFQFKDLKTLYFLEENKRSWGSSVRASAPSGKSSSPTFPDCQPLDLNLGGVLGPHPSKTALLKGKPREMQMAAETAEQTRGSYYRRMSLLSDILQ